MSNTSMDKEEQGIENPSQMMVASEIRTGINQAFENHEMHGVEVEASYEGYWFEITTMAISVHNHNYKTTLPPIRAGYYKTHREDFIEKGAINSGYGLTEATIDRVLAVLEEWSDTFTYYYHPDLESVVVDSPEGALLFIIKKTQTN